MRRALAWLLGKAADLVDWFNQPRLYPDKIECRNCGETEVVYHWEFMWSPEVPPVWECTVCHARWVECYTEDGEVDKKLQG